MDALYITHIVAPEDAGLPVKTLLRQRMGLSTNLLRRLKQTPGGILLEGTPAGSVAVPEILIEFLTH